MAQLNIDSGLELRITNGKGVLYLNNTMIPGQINSTIRFERGSRGTMGVEFSMMGVKVVHTEQIVKVPAHNHPLPEGFTAHDGSEWPEGLSAGTLVHVQYGNGDYETEEYDPSTVEYWHDCNFADNNWFWQGKPAHADIIAYRVVSK